MIHMLHFYFIPKKLVHSFIPIVLVLFWMTSCQGAQTFSFLPGWLPPCDWADTCCLSDGWMTGVVAFTSSILMPHLLCSLYILVNMWHPQVVWEELSNKGCLCDITKSFICFYCDILCNFCTGYDSASGSHLQTSSCLYPILWQKQP